MKYNRKPRLLSKIGFRLNYNITDSSIKEIGYYYLKTLILKKESFILFVGGFWCRNCTPFVPILDEFLKENNMKCYAFDPRIGMRKTYASDIRFCKTKPQERMMQFISNHLNIDLEKRINQTYKLKVPIVLLFDAGESKLYWSKEYVSSDITNDVRKSIKEELKKLIKK